MIKPFFSLALVFLIASCVLGQEATKSLKRAGSYQTADDTSDRAADAYRETIKNYPNSAEAEAAQFFLASYYNRKFYILEQRNQVQDWDSLNRAEAELYKYKGKYPRGTYLADAYHLLAIIALRRGYRDAAASWLATMKQAAATDRKVYIFRLTWSPNASDLIRGYCDTASLADADLDALRKTSSFNDAVSAVTSWARAQCH
jgi:hypothetical protein